MRAIRTLLNNEFSFLEGLRARPSLTSNLFSLYFNKRNYGGPTFITWELTNQCQCKCKHCERDIESKPLSRFERLEIVKNIILLPTRWISLLGGEPFIVPEIIEIAEILKSKGKKVTITTNGLLLKEFIKDLIRIKIDAIHLSVDSHRSEVHDCLRNTPGLFNNLLDSIMEIRKNRISRKVSIKLRCTISKANYRELIEYVEFWKDKADAIYFQPIVDNNLNRVRDKSLLFTEGDEDSFRDILSRLQNRNSSFRNIYYSLMPEYIFNRQGFFKKLNYQCLLTSSCGLNILPNGCITICYGRRENVSGNALHESIMDIWRKPETMVSKKNILNTPAEYFYSQCFCWDPNTAFNLYLVFLSNWIKTTFGLIFKLNILNYLYCK